ncbi:hypothetical protein HAZT_HAZT000427 [Hyalella azteca]|uniref:BTB domain-containing protein n=1 Tax=Hyalella azteca TaxID=294128 RepID=A0A6A0H2I9_HYAAZ|nr:hypothetical protein HAZT_HAZT000427 [Hyalella azteca]
MDNEQPHQELVKCVVVGDTAVGKTRLVWARAGNKQFSLVELLNTHVPTVWAIDQYRVCKEGLVSCIAPQSINVCILFSSYDPACAHGRSDVVLLCFSVASPVSLRNCRVRWYPEIRKFCPNTPILLVGCKNDLRHICKDEEYKRYCRERSPLVRATRECDLVMPAEGRAVARDMGIEYYETSVLSYYGVPEVFENVVRAALVARRHQRFWITNLKKVQRPLAQVSLASKLKSPDLLTAKIMPDVTMSSFAEDLHCLYQCSAFTDLVLIAGSTIVHAHRFLAAAASTALQKVLLTELSDSVATRRSSDSSMVSGTFGDTNIGNFNSDTECLIATEQPNLSSVSGCVANCRLRDVLKRRSSVHTLQPPPCPALGDQRPGIHKALNHPAFSSISIEQVRPLDALNMPIDVCRV